LDSPLIYIVDDDDDVRASVASFLRSAGHSVLSFPSAEDFLGSPARADAACLITDLHMPGMDGLELQEELRASGQILPVIVMTAFPTDAARRRASQLGVAAFLAKPVDPDALLDHVEAALSS
jgi:FixJ family two-component response regulator